MSGMTALRANEPTEIAGYRLLGRLGEGGMGTVYLAQSPDGSRVALKIIRDHLLDREEYRLRFRGGFFASVKLGCIGTPPFRLSEGRRRRVNQTLTKRRRFPGPK